MARSNSTFLKVNQGDIGFGHLKNIASWKHLDSFSTLSDRNQFFTLHFFFWTAYFPSECKATILAKSLGTLSQKHRKFAHPPSAPNAVLIWRALHTKNHCRRFQHCLGWEGGGQWPKQCDINRATDLRKAFFTNVQFCACFFRVSQGLLARVVVPYMPRSFGKTTCDDAVWSWDSSILRILFMSFILQVSVMRTKWFWSLSELIINREWIKGLYFLKLVLSQ